MFATVFCAVLNIRTGELRYSNAGHNPPLMYIKEKGSFEYMKVEHGFVLGVMDTFNYKTCNCTMNPGDFIFLYTDGVTEAMDREHKLYSEKRLLNFVNSLDQFQVESVINSMRQDLLTFVQDEPQSDDITMLTLHYKGL